jgi:hypothetical protein
MQLKTALLLMWLRSTVRVSLWLLLTENVATISSGSRVRLQQHSRSTYIHTMIITTAVVAATWMVVAVVLVVVVVVAVIEGMDAVATSSMLPLAEGGKGSTGLLPRRFSCAVVAPRKPRGGSRTWPRPTAGPTCGTQRWQGQGDCHKGAFIRCTSSTALHPSLPPPVVQCAQLTCESLLCSTSEVCVLCGLWCAFTPLFGSIFFTLGPLGIQMSVGSAFTRVFIPSTHQYGFSDLVHSQLEPAPAPAPVPAPKLKSKPKPTPEPHPGCQ